MSLKNDLQHIVIENKKLKKSKQVLNKNKMECSVNTSLCEIMKIIDDNSNNIKSGDYLKLCDNLKNIHEQEQQNEKRFAQRDNIIKTNGEYLCKQSVQNIFEYIDDINECIQVDEEFSQWKEDLDKFKNMNPYCKNIEFTQYLKDKYMDKCLFEIYTNLSMHGKNAYNGLLGYGNIEKEELKSANCIDKDMSDDDIILEWFIKLENYYFRKLDNYVYNEVFDKWRDFSHSEGFKSILKIMQEGNRALVWRKNWYKRMNMDIFNETDASIHGREVEIINNFVIAEEEPYDSE